ncbi:MocR-like pyridoxine biosynthesis transcription factor PdxR [Streptomyces cacaoi]|uniref:MocR-like pyridoxine biosynthesis transcription factor PdxR n=1 Tax=Streptomyces cacaoi TaxID=1898 RepID=UPI0037490549
MRSSWAIPPDGSGPPGPAAEPNGGRDGGRDAVAEPDAAGSAEGAEGTGVARVAGVDLHLDLARGLGGRGARGTRAALIAAVRGAIRTGRLAPGTRLPSSRSLAVDLGLARNTVAGAYAELTAEGWLTARRGAGTRVAHRAAPAPARRPHHGPPPGLPGGPRPLHPVHELRTGRPDVTAFPRQSWLTSARRALTAAPARAFAHGDRRGAPELRRALADYLARARGVRADPERILVCSGFAQGLALLARVVRGDGGNGGDGGDGGDIAVEEHGLPFHRELLEHTGPRTLPLTVDERGARTTDLDSRPDLAGVRAVLLTPAHQFPTGVALHADRRSAVVDWARRTGGLVLEDDYDGEFRYDRHPVGALQGLDPERVVHLGTSSKALAPALRLAWAVLPDHLVDAVLAAKTPAEWTIPALEQLTLADFLERGAYDRHVRAMRQRYRSRRDRLVTALAERAPGVRATGIAAGLHAVLELPAMRGESAQRTETRLVRAAARCGVALDAGGDFRHPDAPAHPLPSLVVGYGAPAEHGFPAALDALCEVLADRERAGPGGAGAYAPGGA